MPQFDPRRCLIRCNPQIWSYLTCRRIRIEHTLRTCLPVKGESFPALIHRISRRKTCSTEQEAIGEFRKGITSERHWTYAPGDSWDEKKSPHARLHWSLAAHVVHPSCINTPQMQSTVASIARRPAKYCRIRRNEAFNLSCPFLSFSLDTIPLASSLLCRHLLKYSLKLLRADSKSSLC
ncbi:hypothetical protein KC343_g6 [Hortaea werneckii]|nr:hypothetical protein KC317_g6 [Hortaea werneckii]KAI7628716.1 hypothetical protein KC346_g6 [Hortaea werneckii]KAI7638514.1 hypothetical protein KC343_g6 [Hortaea werneckii]